jgi:hypothetical protein
MLKHNFDDGKFIANVTMLRAFEIVPHQFNLARVYTSVISCPPPPKKKSVKL